MKPIIIQSDFILSVLSAVSIEITHLTFFPFILTRNKAALKEDVLFFNHEMIHVQQQFEFFVLGLIIGLVAILLGKSFLFTFLSWPVIYLIMYYGHWLINRVKYRNHEKPAIVAYQRIIFEQEAYKNQSNPNYLESRKYFAWLRKA